MIRLVCILSILAGCAGGSVKAPEPVADPEWYTKDFLSFNEHGNSMDLGNMSATSCGTQAMYDYLDATRDRREALADSINAWYKTIDRRVVEALTAGADPKIVIDGLRDEIGQPINPFLSKETLFGGGGGTWADFMERIADDIYFAEGTLGMSIYQFQSHVGRHLKKKIKHYLDHQKPDHIEIIDDTTPVPRSSDWPDSSTPETLEKTLSLIDVNQADAEARLTQVEEQFELKKPTMSQSEIEEFELHLRIAKEAFRYLKEQTEEFKRLIKDE